MVIHRDAAEGNLEVVILFEHAKPSQIFVSDVTGLVIASHLEVPSVLAQAHCELPLLNDVLLLHHVVNGLEPIQIHSRLLTAETQDAISFLGVEVLGFSVDAAKGVFKHVDTEMEVFTEVHAVLGNVTFVA